MNNDRNDPIDAPRRRQNDLIADAWRQFERLRSGSTVAVVGDGVPRLPGLLLADPSALPGYRLLREIHRGGQGVVYEALQLSTNRSVAVKLMRDGRLAGPRERIRFDREVQILAQLRHPNIVAIHDSGRAGDAAYFVMDYIAGLQLDHFVEHKRPDLRSRLSLFARICEAVNAAHLRGVIHRDLKPGNVRIDENGKPHVLDFGLAKQSALTDDSGALTETGQFVGSLPWASPEQAEGRSELIDLRTDVYALGVMLYQLLTGDFPYRISSSLHETTNNIVNTEPRDPRELNSEIDDDVATIVLKCLRKLPELRYQSAGELQRDIEHYLRGEPIEARSDSALYILRKHFARHRVAAFTVLGVFLLTIVGFVVSLTLWRQAEFAREAERTQRHIAEASEKRAQAETVTARATSEFLRDMLAAADPTLGATPDLTVRQALDAAAKNLDRGDLSGQPTVEIPVRRTIGMTYLRLGLQDEAQRHLERAVSLAREHIGPGRELAVALNGLAQLEDQAGNLDESEALYKEVMTMTEELAIGGSRELSDLLSNYGLLLYHKREFETAQQMLEEALKLDRRDQSPNHPALAHTLNNLGLVVRDRGDLNGAEAMFREAMAILIETYGEQHVHVATLMENIGSLAVYRGDLKEAEALYRRALAARRKVVSGDHPLIATSLNNLGHVLNVQQRYSEAEPLLRECVELRKSTLGETHPNVATALNNLALCCANQGRHGEAEALYREALQIRVARYGEKHPNTLLQMVNLSATLRALHRLEEAEEFARLATERAQEAFTEANWERGGYRCAWGAALLGLKRYEEAERELLRGYSELVAVLGENHVRCRDAASYLVRLYEATERPSDADSWRLRAPASRPSGS